MSVMGEKANGTIPNAPSNTSAASLSSHYTEKSNQKLETRDICGSVGDMERLDVTKTNSHHQPEPDVEKPASDGPAFAADAEENYKPKTVKFWLVILCTMGSMFLVALDRTILSTAVPRITDDFKSLGDIGWYGSAYMLTTAAFQLVFGRVYRFYDLRWTYLGCILIFEVGSTLCGAAPTSNVFIVGRAIAGVGSAGILTGSMMTIIPMVPLHKRPMFQSLFGIVFGVSSIAGPLVGGAFTEKVSWRWCFYLNLPVGAVAFACLFFFLHPPSTPKKQVTFKEQVMRLDPLGTFFFIPSTVCLLLALQWGGSTYAWNNWRIIFLFIMFAITGIAFAVVQVKMPETASLPVRVITQRTMLSGTFYMMFLAGSMMLCVFYIPLWFQTTHNVDPVKSGIYTIPLVLSLVVASIGSAAVTQRSGYYVPSMIASPCIMAVGEGLLTTFKPTTGSPHWIAYQFLVGFGIGFGMQTVGLAVQAILPKEDIPTGVAITFFAQQLGGAIFVSVGQTILSGVLVSQLSHISGLDANMIVTTGATELHRLVPEQFMETVVYAYNNACTRIFFAAMALSFAQLVCAFGVEWRSIRKVKQDVPSEETTKAESISAS